jgi:large subunit ribosomal protein L21e
LRKLYKGNFSCFVRTVLFELETARWFCKIKMAKGKRVRQKGKLRLSSYFKKVEDGASVALVTDAGVRCSYPQRMKGMSGKVTGSRGRFKLVEIKDGNKLKTLIVHPVHLRKL